MTGFLPVFLNILCIHVCNTFGVSWGVYYVAYSARLHEVINVTIKCDHKNDTVIIHLASGTSTSTIRILIPFLFSEEKSLKVSGIAQSFSMTGNSLTAQRFIYRIMKREEV